MIKFLAPPQMEKCSSLATEHSIVHVKEYEGHYISSVQVLERILHTSQGQKTGGPTIFFLCCITIVASLLGAPRHGS